MNRKFTVKINRLKTETVSIEVEASDEDAASAMALGIAGLDEGLDWELDDEDLDVGEVLEEPANDQA